MSEKEYGTFEELERLYLKKSNACAGFYKQIEKLTEERFKLRADLEIAIKALEEEQHAHSGPHSEGWTCSICDALARIKGEQK